MVPPETHTPNKEKEAQRFLDTLREVITLANERLAEAEEVESGPKKVHLLNPNTNRIYEIVDRDPSEREPGKRKRPHYSGKARDALSSGLHITCIQLTKGWRQVEYGKHADRFFARFRTGRAVDAVDLSEVDFLSRQRTKLHHLISARKDLREGFLVDGEKFDQPYDEIQEWIRTMTEALIRRRSRSIIKVGKRRRRRGPRRTGR